MTNVPPNERPPRTAWRPPPGGYQRPGSAPPPPPPPPPQQPPPTQQAPGWQQQPPAPGGYGYQQQPSYQQQPYGYQQPYGQQYPPPPQNPPGRVLSIIAFSLAGVALILLPPIFMIAGVVLSIIAITKGDSLGKWALGASIAGGVLGMVIAFLVFGSMD